MDIKITNYTLLERITDRLDPLLGRYWSFMAISIDDDIFLSQFSLPASMVTLNDEQFEKGIQSVLIEDIMKQLNPPQRDAFYTLLHGSGK